MPRTYETVFDTENAYNWSEITYTYEDGVLLSADSLLDTGYSKVSFYSDSRLSSIELYDSEENLFDWDRIFTTYGPDGTITSQDISYDDGGQQYTTYVDGIRREVDRYDDTGFDGTESGVYDWRTIHTSYDVDGTIVSREVEYDDGGFEYTTYINGIRSEVERYDDAGFDGTESGAYDWQTIRTYYDEAGTIARREVEYDDGTYQETAYVGGIRSLVERYDDVSFGSDGGAYDWETIRTYYDEAGTITSREVVYDGGISQRTTYVDGVRSFDIRVEDVTFGSDGSYDWDTIQTYFDEAGTITSREVYYDDGISERTFYVDGVRSLLIRYDSGRDESGPSGSGLHDWSSIVYGYATDGSISHRNVYYDDGTRHFKIDFDGQRVNIRVDENFDTRGDVDVYDWTDITTIFDDDDIVTQRVVRNDDGTSQTTDYVDGQRVSILREDGSEGSEDNFDWASILITFDADGNVASKSTVYDDTDELLFLYEGGQRTTRLEYDRDNSEDWFLRVTDFDPAGKTVTTYDTPDDVPLEYSDQVFVL